MAKRRAEVERIPLTRELIASVASDLIDAEGIEALTMRSVAAKLGVSAMALYHHVADKDEIVRLVGDDILASIELPDPDSGDWRDLLTDAVHAIHEALLRVPGMTAVMMSRSLLPNARRVLFFCINQFERAGLSAEDAQLAYAGLHQLSIGHLMVEMSWHYDVHTQVAADDELVLYMDALHSQRAFDEALAGLLDHYTPSARPAKRTALSAKRAATTAKRAQPRKASPTARKTATPRSR